MGTVRVRPEIFKAYFEIGQEFKIPVVVSKDYKAEVLSQNFDKSNIDASQIIWVDKIYGKSNDSPIDLKSWENFYSSQALTLLDKKSEKEFSLIEKKYFNEWQKELEMYHSGGGKESLEYVTFLMQKK